MGSNGWMKTLGLAGAALAAWYFLDPNKGAERRNKIARDARDLYDTTKDELTRVSKDLASGVGDTVKSVSDSVGGTVKSMTDSVGGTVKSVSDSVSGLLHQNGGQNGGSQRGTVVDGNGTTGRAATSGV